MTQSTIDPLLILLTLGMPQRLEVSTPQILNSSANKRAPLNFQEPCRTREGSMPLHSTVRATVSIKNYLFIFWNNNIHRHSRNGMWFVMITGRQRKSLHIKALSYLCLFQELTVKISVNKTDYGGPVYVQCWYVHCNIIIATERENIISFYA